MQQLSRTCMIADHKLKVIEYVCTYPNCQLSRFLCSKCALGNSHKHDQQDNQHIVDNTDFYEMMKKNLHQAKGNKQLKNYDIEKSIVPLQQLIQEINKLLKNIQNIIQSIQQGKLQNNNINDLENNLLNVQKYGFNQIDDQQLNNLINKPNQQQDLDIEKELEDQANLIIQNVLKIKEWRFQQPENQLLQKIKDVKYQIQQIDTDDLIYTGAISNDLKYVVSGGQETQLKIWDYQQNKLIQSIKLNYIIWSCKFTENSTLLYVESNSYIHQFDIQNQFNELYKQEIHDGSIKCIYCLSNAIILTKSYKTIIKTDVNNKQQLLKIQAHNDGINGLDYNQRVNIIASGSNDQSIKLQSGNDGQLILEKINAHNNQKSIRQVLFINNNNQLISLDSGSILIIWNINYEKKLLEQLYLIQDFGYNVSLVLQQQYIIATGNKFIKVFSNKGEFVRQLDHEINKICHFNTIQLDSMKAVLIKGEQKLQVCQIEID